MLKIIKIIVAEIAASIAVTYGHKYLLSPLKHTFEKAQRFARDGFLKSLTTFPYSTSLLALLLLAVAVVYIKRRFKKKP